jgi:hypothetical protein
MMPRIQGLFEFFSAADLLIKACPGEMHSITIAWKGCAAGDFVLLRDGVTVAGSTKVPFIFPAAQGTITKEWPQGKKFDTGIYLDIGGIQAGGSVFVEGTAK